MVREPGRLASFLKGFLLIAIVGGGYLLARSLGLSAVDREAARAWAAAHPLAPLAFGLLYAALVVAAVPGAPLTLACGFTFGLVEGSAIALLGANLGANGAFLLARLLGRELVTRLLGARVAAVEERLREGGPAVIVTLRLIPFVPFVAINFVAGIVPGVRWRDYAFGTAVGIIPGTVAYTALGEFPDPTRPEFWIAFSAIQLLAAIPIGVRIFRRKRAGSEPQPQRDSSRS
jgi:uncharacterized membrane protein YdjX (TVP38/TMEM64 family)